MSKLKYASFTLTLRQPYAAEIAALRAGKNPSMAGASGKRVFFRERAATGGLDPSWQDLAFLGRPNS